jgi:FKBP-type peptidyl-prolyl cis-trans isomerase (trigger factor)
MKVEAKKLDAGKVQLDIEVPAEIVNKKFDQVYERIGKDAKIPGFRPGKAPRDILEKHHGRLAREELIKNLIPEAYRDSLEREKISAIELPEISEVKLEANTLSFKATVEVKPEIALKDYKNIKLKYEEITVSPDEVEKALENLKESHKAQSIDEKFSRSLGYPTVLAMRASVQRQLFVQKENDGRYHLQEGLIKEILDNLKFKTPQSLLERRFKELVHQAKAQLASRGMSKEQIDSQEGGLRKELYPEAESQVKTYLVLDEIARRENIPEDEHMSQKVIEFLLREADWEVSFGGKNV